MKIVMACLLTLGYLAHAQGDADDELVRALQNLNSRGLYIDTSTRAVVQDRAVKVFIAGAVFGAAMAAANSRLFFGWRKTTSITELYIADGSLIAMVASGVTWVAAEAFKRFERPPMPLPAGQYVGSVDAMNDYFRLPIDQQISIAKQDESLKKFVLTMSRAYDFTDKRMPDEPMPPEAQEPPPAMEPANDAAPSDAPAKKSKEPKAHAQGE